MKQKKTDFDYRKVVDDLKTRPAKLRRTLGTIQPSCSTMAHPVPRSVEPIAVVVTPDDLAYAELRVRNRERWHCDDVEFHKNVKSDLEEELLAARLAGNGSEAAAGGRRGKPPLSYPRSALKRAVLVGLTQKPHSTDRSLCDWMDEQGYELPSSLVRAGDRTFTSAYLDPKRKPNIESIISKVRKDMREAGLLKD